MAPCTSANCKKREEELLAHQLEQRRLLASHVATHAAKVASANTNLLKGILETGGFGGMVEPEEISMAVISTLKAEVKAKKNTIAQSKAGLQQRERLFSHPLNDDRSMMSEEELHRWRGVHRKLTVVEGRRVKELEREIIRVALGRELDGAEEHVGTAEKLGRTPSNTEDEVSTDIEMDNPAGEDTPEEEAISGSCPIGKIISDKEVEEEEVVEVGAEVLGGAQDEVSAVLALTETENIQIPTQILQLKTTIESSALLCKDCSDIFSTTELLLAHAMTKHWVRGSRHRHCPLKGCGYVAMNGGYGIVKLRSHMEEKHTPCTRNCGSNILTRQNWPQSSSKSANSVARQAAKAGTARTDIQRPSNSTWKQATKDETARVVRSKVVKKMGKRSCIAVSTGDQGEEGMKRRNKAVTGFWKKDGDSAGVATRSAQAKEKMMLRSKSLRK